MSKLSTRAIIVFNLYSLILQEINLIIISMQKFICALLSVFILSVFGGQAQNHVSLKASPSTMHTQKPKQKRKRASVAIPTPQQAADKIDNFIRNHWSDTIAYDSLLSIIGKQPREYVNGLPKKFKRSVLSNHYIDRIAALSQTENVDSLYRTCIAVVAINDTAALPTAYEALSVVFGYKADKESLESVLADFSSLSDRLPGNPYRETIESISKEYDDILHPVPFIDQVRGEWVCVNHKCPAYVSYYPYSVIDIQNLNVGGVRLVNRPGRECSEGFTNVVRLRYNQYLDGYDGHFEASFGSEKMKAGNSSFAESGFESTRQLRAKMRATIASSKNASVGDRLGATAVTEVTAGILDYIFASTANSTKDVAALNLSLDLVVPKLLKGHGLYYSYSVDVNNINYRPRPAFDADMTYVKWEPEDSTFFVDSKGNILTCSGSYLPAAKAKVDEIKRNYSWKNKRYLLPTIAAEVGCIGAVVGGIILLSDLNVYDKDGNVKYDSDGYKKFNTGKCVGGIILTMIGAQGSWMIPYFMSGHRATKRNLAYSDLNKASMEKMQRKATLMLSPVIDTDTQGELSFGVGARLTF